LTVIDNSPDSKAKFEKETWPQMEKSLQKEGWTEKQTEALKKNLMNKFGPNGITEMS
jgi:hypothetical protein